MVAPSHALEPTATSGLCRLAVPSSLRSSAVAQRGRWEAVSGMVEGEETVPDAARRELGEEMGPALRARPLGVLHASTFRYDANARFVISIVYLMAYEGGAIEPGDDMRGGGHRWMSLDALELDPGAVGIPREPWMPRRAVEMYRLWRDREVVLQAPVPPG